MGRRMECWRLLAAMLLGASDAMAATVTIRERGASDLNTDTVISALTGSTVTLEIVLDTEGLTLEGYSYGLDFGNGSVTGLSVMHQPLVGLAEDLFGLPAIDDALGTVRNVNQSKLSMGAGLAPGVYVLDEIEFTVATSPSGGLAIAGDRFGEVFGLGEGSCPGTVENCDVTFFSATVVPEPTTGLLLASGLAALAAFRRRSGTPSPTRSSISGV